MNDEETFPTRDNSPSLDPALEARIVAWVAGEASAFEAAELERLATEHAKVAAFRRQIADVQKLAAAAVKPDPQPLQLSAERRAKLLAALGADRGTGVSPVIARAHRAKPGETPVRLTNLRGKAWRAQRWLVAMAACAAVGVFVLFEMDRFSPKESLQIMEADATRPPPRQLLETQAKERESAVKASRDSSEMRRALEKAEAAPRLREEEQPLRSSGTVTKVDALRPASRQEEKRADPRQDFMRMPSVLLPNVSVDAGYVGSEQAPKATDPQSTTKPFQFRFGDREQNQSVTLGVSTAGSVKDIGSITTAGAVIGGTMSLSEASTLNLGAQQPVPQGFLDQPVTLGTSTVGGDLSNPSNSASAASFGSVTLLTSAASAIRQPEPAEQAKKKDEGSNRLSDERKRQDDAALPKRPAPPPPSNQETSAAKEATSTFSLHVSDVSFRLAAAALARGQMPDVANIRPEEFYNAFDYADPAPAVAEKVGCRIEQAAHPFLQQRNLVRIAMKVAATGRGAKTPLRLTVLLDTSGSMERDDRVATVRSAMAVLVSLLGPDDRLTLIGFARQPRLLAENVSGDRARDVLDVIARTPADGGTNLEEALKLASEHALRNRTANAQNRIVVLTDGAANLGNANPDELAKQVEALRNAGIAFDACGVGLDGLDDTVLEALTRKGDGRYYVLNSPEAADAGFAQQLAGAFRPAAENVKLQVRFNPARVGSYRLIGFEQHRLREEDFRNDKVDAAELAADEAGVALYQIEPLPQGEGELGEVFVRFRDPANGAMIERSWTIPYEARAASFDRATPSLQLAGVAALLAEKLRGGAPADQTKLRDLVPVVSTLESHYRNNPRVQELVTMFKNLRRLVGEQ